METEVFSDLNIIKEDSNSSQKQATDVNNGSKFTPEMLDVLDILNSQKYKALILYLLPEHGQPKQDLFDLLGEMAIQNYLCFVCCSSSDSNGTKGIEILGQNLVIIRNGFTLIPIIKHDSAIILSTQAIHSNWKEALSRKFLWFHADSASDLSNDINEMLNQADLISYFQTDEKHKLKFSSDPRSVSLKLGEKQNNWLLVEESFRSNPKCWQAYANLNLQGKIAVMTATFFDFEGEFFYSGGAERYLLDLAVISEELGRELVVFQYGNYPWLRRLKNIDVVALSRDGLRAEGWVVQCAKAFNQVFYEQVQGRAALNIYSAFFEAWPLAATPNIGISHGVAWDNPYCIFENAVEFWLMNERHIQGAKACEELVSVDTNSANWFQTVDFDLGQKTKVIPNYVDLFKFQPREDYLEQRNKIVILYPRQLYSGRGLDLVLEIMDDILANYSDVEFHFVGRGGEQAIAQILEKQKKWGQRVRCYAQAMDEMPQVYRAADISLIPSVHSEGTSLSCLEAMASGNAVIATRIGGLSDLIINKYNGLLIDPRPEALKQALISILENPEQLALFKRRNLDVAQAFSKTFWQERWKCLLKDKLAKAENQVPGKIQRSRAVEIILGENSFDIGKLGELVTTLLMEDCLVYIRAKIVPDHALSFARVQWLAPDSQLFSPCDLTIEW